jgi:UDP-perosamine 4-acetyltransferase
MVLDCLIAAGEVEVAGFLDPDGSRGSDGFHGLEVLGTDELLPELRDRGIVGFAVGLGSVSADGRRRELFDRACWEGMAPVTVLHPSALLAPSSSIGVGCQLMPRAVVNSGARLGVHVLVNTAAIVEHDCRIEDHAHVASGAVLAGGVQIGDGALVGAGATVLQGIRIGAGSVVGAGAVVVRDVPPGETVVGVPASPVERLWDGGRV